MKLLMRVFLVLGLFVTMSSISSCSKSPEKSIIGKWEVVISNLGEDVGIDVGSIWEFHKDGNLSIILDSGRDYHGSYLIGSNSNNIIIQLPLEFYPKGVNETIPINGFVTEISKNSLVLDCALLYEPWHLEFVRTEKSIQTIEERILGTWEVVGCYASLCGSITNLESEYGDLYEFNSSHKIRIQDEDTICEGTYSVSGDLKIAINGTTRTFRIDNLNSTELKLSWEVSSFMIYYYELEKTTKLIGAQNRRIKATANPSEGGAVSGGGTYQKGQ